MVQSAARPWTVQLVDARNERIVGGLAPSSSVWIVAPPGFAKATIRDHLIERFDARSIQPDHDALWTVVVPTEVGASSRVSASRVGPLGDVDDVIGVATLACRAEDLPADAPDAADALIEYCNGWPAYATALATVLDPRDPLPPAAAREVTLLVDRCTTGLDGDARRAASVISLLGRVSPSMLRALDPEVTIDHLRAAGLPLLEAKDGWLSILPPVDVALRDARPPSAGGDLDSADAERLERPMVESMGLVGAAEALVAVGQADRAAALLVRSPRRALEQAHATKLVTLLEVLRRRCPDDGHLALLAAQANEALARFSAQRSHLDDAVRLAETTDDHPLEIEAKAELLLLDADERGIEDVAERLAALERAATAALNQSTRTRLDEITALVSAQSGDLTRIHEAAEGLELVAHEWELLGDHNRAARAIRRMSASCLLHLGEYARASALLARAAALARDSLDEVQRTTGLQLFFAARAADDHRFDELGEVDAKLGRQADRPRWLEAFRSWADMLHAANHGNVERVRQSGIETRARLGELMDGGTGALFLADAAVCGALAGDEALARSYRAEAAVRSDLKAIELLIADATIEGRFGSPEAFGEVLERRLVIEVPAARAWRLDVAHLGAAHRLGLPTDLQPSRIVADAQRFDLGGLAHALLEQAGVPRSDEGLRIEVLGVLRVTADGEPLELPSGKVTELVKLLAVRRAPVPIDIVIDHLWPDADVRRGRTRLRNCVNRLRQALGPEAIERAGETLALSPDVAIDLREFWHAIEQVGDRPTAAAVAARLYRGNLLQTDLYDDWLIADRQAVASAMEHALRRGLAAAAVDEALAETIRHRLVEMG